MRKSRFIKHLGYLNEDELRAELQTLYSKLKEVRDFYAMELGTPEDRKVQYDQAKKQIASKYATKSYRRPRRPRIQKINAILSVMARKTVFTHELIDLYLYDVEMAIQFMRQYDFFSEVLANHIVAVFKKAINLIVELNSYSDWKERCQNILASVRFNIGIQLELEYVLEEAG